MGKLKSLGGRVGVLSSRIARKTDQHGHSAAAEPWRAWYSLARWARLRLDVFERDDFTCQFEACGHVEADTSLLVADHKIKHAGDPDLFWDPTNVQTLCKPCHDRRKQALEKRWPAQLT